MTNREAYEIYTSNENNATTSARNFLERFSISDDHFDKIRIQFGSLKCARDSIRRSRSKSLSDWLEQSFYPFDFDGYDQPNIPIDNTKIHIFEEDFEKERRKPLRN